MLTVVFFYSGLSLAILWAAAYSFSHRKLYLLGVLLHPMAVLIFIIINIRDSFKIAKVVLIYAICVIANQKAGLYIFFCEKAGDLNIDLTSMDFSRVYSKYSEMSVAIIFCILRVKVGFSSVTSYKEKTNKKFSPLLALYLCIGVAMVSFLMIGKRTPIDAYLKSENNLVFSITWLGGNSRLGWNEISEMRR